MTAGKDESTGRFLPGNRFWEARSSHGAKPKFENPADLWDACCQYFEWNDCAPLHEAKAFAYEGNVTVEDLPRMRAMTLAGLCMFLDIDHATWREWRTSRPDLSSVITRAEAVVYRQKFEGASAGLLNSNIIARDLGLAEKNEHTGKDGGAIETRRHPLINASKLSTEELESFDALLSKARPDARADQGGTGEAREG